MKHEKGILLIEVLLALLILDVSVLSLLKYQWQSQKQLQSFERRFMATVSIDNAAERLLAGDNNAGRYLEQALTPFIPIATVSLSEDELSSVIEVRWSSNSSSEIVSRKRTIMLLEKS